MFTTENLVFSGVSHIGGIFIPPLALSILTEGQFIDYDPYIGTQVTVIYNGTTSEGQRLLGIREELPNYSVDYYYNQDGILVNSQILETPFVWSGDSTQYYIEYSLSNIQ